MGQTVAQVMTPNPVILAADASGYPQRRTPGLRFCRARSRNLRLIWVNRRGGTKPYANVPGRPGRGSMPAFGHSSTLCSENDDPTGSFVQPDRLANLRGNLDPDGGA